jgi:hypothetical protein
MILAVRRSENLALTEMDHFSTGLISPACQFMLAAERFCSG